MYHLIFALPCALSYMICLILCLYRHVCCFCFDLGNTGLIKRAGTSAVVLCYRIEYNSPVSRELTRLMKIPVDNYNNLLTVLQLQHYGPLLDLFDYHGRKNLAAYLVTNALDNETQIPTQEQVRNLSTSSLVVMNCHSHLPTLFSFSCISCRKTCM
jgi:hypothetical protein